MNNILMDVYFAGKHPLVSHMSGRLFAWGYNAENTGTGTTRAEEQEFDLIPDYYPPAG